MNLTDAFVTYLLEKAENGLPKPAADQARNCLIDYVGVASAGNRSLRSRFDARQGGSVKIVGCDQQTDALYATFVNAYGAHVLELDDGHRFGMIHLAAPVISAVLSAAQMEDVSWSGLLLGIAMGYEAAVRLAMSMQPEHKKRGFHTSGTCGTIGAAAGVAFALGFDARQLKAAVSAAGTSAAGLLEIQEDGSELKPYNVAHAAMSGFNAALTGRWGLCPPDDFLGGSRGFTRVFCGEASREKLLAEADYFEIQRVYMKPYAACRHCHSAIEAALRLRREVPAEDVQSIEVDTYKLAIKGHDHTDIRGIPSAKLSIPFSVALAYVYGDCGLQAFTQESITDPAVLELMKRVKVRESAEFTAHSPARRIAEVRVQDRLGKARAHRVDYAKGDPENPMTRADLEDKFFGLMKVAGREAQARMLLPAMEREDIRAFMEAL